MTALALGFLGGCLLPAVGTPVLAAVLAVCAALAAWGVLSGRTKTALFLTGVLFGALRALFPPLNLPAAAAERVSGIARTVGERTDALFPAFPGVARGMLLGGRNAAVDPALKERLYAVGIGHLLAVSGLHVSVLAGCILKVWRVGAPKLRFVCLMAFLAGYCILTGGAPSVIRASVMLLYATPLALPPHRRDSMVSLSLALITVLLFDPAAAGGAGFLLSFTAVAGILLLDGPLTRNTAFLPYRLRSGLAVSVAAVLGTLPVSVSFFGEVSAVGVLANLIILPLVPFFLIPAFGCVVLSCIAPGLAACIAQFPQGVLWAILTLADAGGNTMMRIAAPGALACVCYYAAMLAVSDCCRLTPKRKVLAAAACAVTCTVLWTAGL